MKSAYGTAENFGRSISTNRDAAEVCLRLRISKRTLQSYRDRRVLPYSNVGGKFFYREADVTGFLRARTIGKEV